MIRGQEWKPAVPRASRARSEYP
uniref:Uncharacterized protein n=1 Tax=Anguilla anguilla TaxID=7936 RepID=A0A0E9VA31_ANGAN